MSKPTLLYQAPVATRSGYGDHARDLLHSIWKLDKFEIKIISTRWGQTPMDGLSYDNPFHKWIIENVIPAPERKPDIFMQMTVPNEFQPIGHYNIGVTAGIETTAIPMNWLEGCNRMNMVITVSEHSKKGLVETIYSEHDKNTNTLIKQHRVDTPVEVLFEGFDENDFNSKDVVQIKELNEIKEDFAFLFVGHWLRGDIGEDRKNVGLMIKTFALAFKNEKIKPALVLKTSTASFSVRDREHIIRNIKNVLGSDYGKISIYLLHGDLSIKEMNGLYNHKKIKAMVSFTKGEGFGRPLLEFSITGKPVITSNWSGHIDFLKEGAVLLDGELKPVHPSVVDDFIIKESSWFNVNVSNAVLKLKDVYKNYDKYKSASEKLGEHNRAKFTLSKMTEKLDEILKKYSVYERIIEPKQVKIQLPKLKKIELPKLKKLELPKIDSEK
jgi:glycosyltransferase involved in cell wall biosynthesis